MKIITHNKLMQVGKISGCHQMPERSFFIRGMQFPVCARCTGVFIGKVIAYSMFFKFSQQPKFCIMGCILMFLDWFVQYLEIHASTNIRRLITGIIGGYSLATLECTILRHMIRCLLRL